MQKKWPMKLQDYLKRLIPKLLNPSFKKIYLQAARKRIKISRKKILRRNVLFVKSLNLGRDVLGAEMKDIAEENAK